ncbi:MAG TPA: hypothetical protein VGP42_01470 [Stellaceae bacterium]|nr:hypothetical protein [Stellaceae bacterium]
MSCQPIGTRIEGGRPDKAGRLGAADWLSLAAAPTFAVTALLTAVLGGDPLEMLCSAAEHTSPLSGMIPMYLLMSAFHSPPWLKLISSRGNGTRRACDPAAFLSKADSAKRGEFDPPLLELTAGLWLGSGSPSRPKQNRGVVTFAKPALVRHIAPGSVQNALVESLNGRSRRDTPSFVTRASTSMPSRACGWRAEFLRPDGSTTMIAGPAGWRSVQKATFVLSQIRTRSEHGSKANPITSAKAAY